MPIISFGRLPSKATFVSLASVIPFYIQTFLFSLDNTFALGLFAASSNALIAHKVTVILLHEPLRTVSIILFAPFLFVFDIITLIILHRVLASKYRVLQIFAGILCIAIISCSATFVASYIETNAAINWGRSLEVQRYSGQADVQVFSNWKIYSKILAQGEGTSRDVFIVYVGVGCGTMLARIGCQKRDRWETLATAESRKETRRKFINQPHVRLLLLLVIGNLFLPQPWRQMASTLLFDTVISISSVLIIKHLRNLAGDSVKGSDFGDNPLGNLNYNPSNDPFYISNLDSPIHEFVAEALGGLEFTNVVHIVLESMRADSYPFKEDGHLATYIERSFDKPTGAKPITASNVSPFITSLAEQTISWETMWATVPFTHKAMLGRKTKVFNPFLISDYCGQLGLPIDWSVEFEYPAKLYQRCLPQVFRDMNSVTKTEPEILGMMLNSTTTRPSTSDMWETVHIEMATGTFDHEREILEKVGFGTVITAEDRRDANPDVPFDNGLGYFDEYGLELFWQYVDNAIQRFPKNRMYLGWMTTTTHMPFKINPDWLGRNYQPFVIDDDEWISMDKWLNAVRWTDDKLKEIIFGFRERGIENETLFVMYVPSRSALIEVMATTVYHS